MRERIKRLMDAFERGRRFVTHDIWFIGRPGEEIPQGFIIKQIRVVILLVSNLLRGTIMLRASALTFTTILSVVPFLAIMFTLINTFNLGETIYQAVQERTTRTISLIPGVDGPAEDGSEEGRPAESETEELSHQPSDAPAATPQVSPDEEQSLTIGPEEAEAPPDVPAEATGANGAEATGDEPTSPGAQQEPELEDNFVDLLFRNVTGQMETPEGKDYVDPIEWLVDQAGQMAENSAALGTAGLLVFITTIFGLLRNIEVSVNHIWGIRQTRSWYRMFSDYLVITLLLPFVAAAVLGVTAALQSPQVQEQLGPIAFLVRGGQQIVLWLIFSALYFIVPNTRVRVPYALLGGIIASTLWILLSWAYVRFQIGVARYDVIFSIFAQFPVLLMWIYLSWVIFLFGAELCFAYQNEETFAMERFAEDASFAYRESLGVRAMIDIAHRFENGQPGLAPETAAKDLNVPSRLLNDTLENLQDASLVIACNTDPVTYQPARSLEKITVADVLTAIRERGREPSRLREEEGFKPLFDKLDHRERSFEASTMEDLIEQFEPGVPRLEHKADADSSGEAHAS